MKYYQGTGDINAFLNESKVYFSKIAKKDNKKLGTLLTSLKDYRSNEKAKSILLDVSGQMVKNEDSWSNLITYAQILHLNDQNEKAIEICNKAIDKSSNAKEKRAVKSILSKIDSKV